MASLTLNKVGKTYPGGVSVVNDVSLEIADGEFCVFVGPSGCGKSTLLRMIAGLEDITEGDLMIGDRRVNDLAPSERNVAMVFQNYALYPHMSVAQNLGFGLGMSGVPRAKADAQVREVATMLQIDHLLERRPKDLSGGQRQRVAIGRALVRNPGVFLFDEPLSNLDAALRTQTRLEIARLHRAHGRAATVYVTHDQVEAMTLADRMVLLQPAPPGSRQPSVAQSGPPMTLYNAPRNLFVAGFLGSPRMNFLPAHVVSLADRAVLVQLADGTHLSVAVRPGEVAVGSAATLGIRAEHLALSPAEAGADHHDNSKNNGNHIRASVQWLEHLGDQSFAYVHGPGNTPMVVRLKEHEVVKIGDTITLNVPAGRAHLFDAAGDALVRAPAGV
ncbi:ABC transporter ATP-binding protein [Ideonella margarita]|uniref:Sn-glycerol-3-phosphate ABC transporter ATP-binding protein UgpC n=1 Tax=Ideonella margarita TaxID=2984191 RepID=A0ABU9CAL0_9BURK